MNQEILDTIKKIHVNLGHPGKATMMRMMRAAGASQVAVEGTKQFYDHKVCDLCEANRMPKIHRKAKPRITADFNVQLNPPRPCASGRVDPLSNQ